LRGREDDEVYDNKRNPLPLFKSSNFLTIGIKYELIDVFSRKAP
jgi:hypothetical protein